MRKEDRRLVSSRPIQYGATLERVINATGDEYSLIMMGPHEVWSCPTDDERLMLDAWGETGSMWGVKNPHKINDLAPQEMDTLSKIDLGIGMLQQALIELRKRWHETD